MNTPRILVPLDGSKAAECALPFAVEIAHKLNASIDLVYVVRQKVNDRHCRVDTCSESGQHFAEPKPSEHLSATATRIKAVSSVPVHSHVLIGMPFKQLVRHASMYPPELIVMSTHGRGPLNREWLGSVVDRLVREKRSMECQLGGSSMQKRSF
jgi:nucleotide-binding universal stress UspA family protein